MTTITVEPTENSILISEAGDDDATAKFTALPPLTAARYLVVGPGLSERLRELDTSLLEGLRPHAHSTLVVLDAGFGATSEGESTSPAQRLAAELGVTVVAAAGRFLSCDGALFAVGSGNSWIAYSPRGTQAAYGRRYPEPSWQQNMPTKIDGTVQIPAGLWITASADPSHAVHLATIAVHPHQLLIVVGSPNEPTPEYEAVRDVLRTLPAETRAATVLIGYGDTSLSHETIRLLSEDLQQPIRIAHGVMRDGDFVRLNLAQDSHTGTFARESVCTPDGVFELERWSAPLGLTTVSRNTYQLSHNWHVDVVPAGLVIRPAHGPSGGEREPLPVVADELTIMLCGEDASDPQRVIAPLRTLLERLRHLAHTRLIPGDAPAKRMIRNAFPGMWAPTAQLVVTEDGRIIAASVDEDEQAVAEEEHSAAPAEVGSLDRLDVTMETKTELEPKSEPKLKSKFKSAFKPASEHITAVHSEPTTTHTPTPTPTHKPTPTPTVPEGTAATTLPPAHRPPHPPHPPQNGADTASPPADSSGISAAATALPQPIALPLPARSDPSDALARALRGSAATADLLAGTSTKGSAVTAVDTVTGAAGTESVELSLPSSDTATDSRVALAPRRPDSDRAEASATPASDVAPVQDAPAPEAALQDASAESPSGDDLPVEDAPVEDAQDAPAEAPANLTEIDIPRLARSTAAQRHRVRSALGSRYDVASRSVSQLLAQQPGMRVSSGDRSTLLTTLSVVSVFADDPTARYDIDFHTCLAEGLAALPTTRSIVVRGLPSASTAEMNTMLSSRTPFISAPADGPLTGPMEALIWTTSARRLDRLMSETDAASDVIVPAHTQLRVLGTADGPVPRLLLAEPGVNEDNVLSRLRDAAARRDENPSAMQDSRWLGELMAAV
ncbi:MAG: hypothetical protein ACTH8F_11630 [Microbacterium sp.]|uniref:hypothetical protein n=1 Tax=Microbacterium sp. TaxID=51671 RepID=UPI003F95359D